MCDEQQGRRAAEVAPHSLPPKPTICTAQGTGNVSHAHARASLELYGTSCQHLTCAAVAVLVSSAGHGHSGRSWASTTVTDLRLDGQNPPSLAGTKEAVAAHVVVLVRMPTLRPPPPPAVVADDNHCC